jgi:cell division protein FtsL
MGKQDQKRVTNGITFGMVMVILMSMSIVLILAVMKIYLSNQIYYKSKKVNKVAQEISILKAEQTMLTQNVEALRFKNRVSDTIFTIEEEE